MATTPSLSSAFSNLISPFSSLFKAPATPQTSSYTSYGVSSPSALASAGMSKAPAVPNMSVYTPPKATPAPASVSAYNASYPNSGANMSYVNPANATASKGTVPYIPAGVSGGGMSVATVPNSTSAATGKPAVAGQPNVAIPSNFQTPAATPTASSAPQPTARAIAYQSQNPGAATAAAPFSAPASPDTSAFSGGSTGSGAASASGTSGSSGGFNVGGSYGSPGALPYAWNSMTGNSTQPDTTDPYGLSYFYSTEQQKAEKAYQDSLQMTPEEKAAQENLNNLNSSFKQAYTNAQGQAIPMAFITGQQKNLQSSEANLAAPLEGQLSLLQAQRQLAGTAAKSALDQANDRITNFDAFMKPVPTAYGGTLSQFDPTTGTYKTLVNPFGTATGTATGTSSGDISAQIGSAIANGQITQDMVTRYGIPFIAATLKADPGYNFITQKASVGADSASLKTQQAYVDTTQRAFNTANANLASLQGFMQQYGLNQSSVPMINQITNKVKAAGADPGAIAAFTAALAGLRTEYAQVLSRGGEVTDSARANATSLIPDNISPAQLAQVAERLNTEGQNAITEATNAVTNIKARVGSNSGSSSTNFGTSGGGTTSASDPLGIL